VESERGSDVNGTASQMLVMVRCVIYDGQRAESDDADAERRIAHVHEGQVRGAWRAIDGRIGFALLHVASTSMIASLLIDSFPGSRHVDVVEVLAVDSISDVSSLQHPSTPGKQRKTGS
jgi:hypothetical protein